MSAPSGSFPNRNRINNQVSGKRKAWMIEPSSAEDQQNNDPTENLDAFLSFIEKDPLHPSLSAFRREIKEILDREDAFTRKTSEEVKNKSVDDNEKLEALNTTFVDDLAKGLKSRLEALDKTAPMPKEFAGQMETWFLKHLQAHQAELKKAKSKISDKASQSDRERHAKYQAKTEADETRLLKLCWEVKKAFDNAQKKSKEETQQNYTNALKAAASAQGVNIDAVLTAAAEALARPSTTAGPSTPISANKRRNTSVRRDNA